MDLNIYPICDSSSSVLVNKPCTPYCFDQQWTDVQRLGDDVIENREIWI